MITRRRFLKGLGWTFAGGALLGGYSVLVEPMLTRVQRYAFTPPNWPKGLKLNIAALADIHACRPWMSPERIAGIVAETNALNPDMILLLGDFISSTKVLTKQVPPAEFAAPLANLKAPLGVHAVLGNHDWWEDRAAQARGSGPTETHLALRDAGLKVYENDAVRLEKDSIPFWIAGLGDQWAFLGARRRARSFGVDDLPGTLAQVSDEHPIILMIHEPDIFPAVPPRVALTLAGHTHGGQVRIFGYAPRVPSIYGNRYAYGHIIEREAASGAEKNLIVSGGLGNSVLPVRFGIPPEIVIVELG